MRNKATRTNEWEREHFGGSPLDPFESSKGYSTDGGAAVTLWVTTSCLLFWWWDSGLFKCWRAFLFAEGLGFMKRRR